MTKSAGFEGEGMTLHISAISNGNHPTRILVVGYRQDADFSGS
jgi:hypothetical protein